MKHHQINYVEFPAKDLAAIKEFYASSFGWAFTDYGPTYIAFSESGVDGGFSTEAQPGRGALVILYSDHLEETRDIVQKNGGTIVQDIYAFPGGRRFHFADPSGNELAVWSER